MALFCDGEKRGVWSGGFTKNEKKRGLVLPPMLRGFLENYGYLGINCAHSSSAAGLNDARRSLTSKRTTNNHSALR